MEARQFSEEFLQLRDALTAGHREGAERDHHVRAADWVLELDPDAPEPVVIAALMHDFERSVPGGPVLDLQAMAWDDAEYTELHCRRSADLVELHLRRLGVSVRFVDGVRDPILQHEMGGTHDGNLMQAGDSLSWFEVLGPRAASWALDGLCTAQKARTKLDWMYTRIRHPAARAAARPLYERALNEFDELTRRAACQPSR